MSENTNTERTFKSGEVCPRSGQYAIVDKQGVVTKRERTLVRGKRFPPLKDGQGYVLVDPTGQDDNTQYSRLVLSLCGYYMIVMTFSFWLLFDTWSSNFALVRLIGVSGQALEEPLLRTIGFTIIAGIIGSVLYQIRMLFKWYARRRQFDPRWLGKYLTAPWEGAGLAMVVLALIRGGVAMFGGSMDTDVTALTNFAAFGTGALVGFAMRDVIGWIENLARIMFAVRISERDDSGKKTGEEEGEKTV